MRDEREEKYNSFLDSLYKDLQEEELQEADMFEDDIAPHFEKAVAKPDMSIRFPNKELLKKKEEGKIHRLYRYAAPAMSIAAMLFLGFVMQSQMPDTGSVLRHVNNEEEKVLPNFPVMQSPLNTNYTSSSSQKVIEKEYILKSMSVSGASPEAVRTIDAKLESMSREQIETALRLIRNRTMEYSSASNAIPPSEEFISSLVMRSAPGIEQTGTRIFLDEPINTADNGSKFIQKDGSNHGLNNLDKDNLYSLRLSLCKW